MQAPTARPVEHPVMLHHWRWLTFLHWRYPAEVVQALLPDGLTVETYDGTAWVGLVPLLMDDVRLPRLPSLPWLGRFPETNLRTYVHGPDGETGIWFFSLDADRLPVVLTARASYGLPYFWSSMSVQRRGDEVTYRSRRRWPGPAGAHCDARVAFGEVWDDAQLSPLDHFLTARFRLYSTFGGHLVAADAEHPPWTLRRVAVRRLRQDLLPAGGLPAPGAEPLLHAADGVRVRIGLWQPV